MAAFKKSWRRGKDRAKLKHWADLVKGAAMSDNAPWVAQVFDRDRKLERFQRALEVIANLEPHLDEMAPDRALAILRKVATAARVALER
jgi:hypothetical protein